MRELQFTMWLPWSVEEAFEFFGDVRKLDLVTPPWFRLVPIASGQIRPRVGDRIDYALRWRGWPTNWQSIIRAWQRPREICYEQARGPFRFFRHEHWFTAADGGVQIVDRLRFEAPGGWLAAHFIVEPELARIFRFRERACRGLEAQE